MNGAKQYFVYIMTNKSNRVLYTGLTNSLIRRVHEHKNKNLDGFTKKYKVCKLVYFECFDNPENAIKREKQLKGGSRKKKIELIEQSNSEWEDLSEKL